MQATSLNMAEENYILLLQGNRLQDRQWCYKHVYYTIVSLQACSRKNSLNTVKNKDLATVSLLEREYGYEVSITYVKHHSRRISLYIKIPVEETPFMLEKVMVEVKEPGSKKFKWEPLVQDEILLIPVPGDRELIKHLIIKHSRVKPLMKTGAVE